jgi:hypothetical protein
MSRTRRAVRKPGHGKHGRGAALMIGQNRSPKKEEKKTRVHRLSPRSRLEVDRKTRSEILSLRKEMAQLPPPLSAAGSADESFT